MPGQALSIPEALAEGFRRLSLDAIEDEVEVQARQALGLCLGRLGDPRIFDLRDPGAYVEVPAGTYPYGEEGKTVEIEAPFLLGRYPVTNSQYQAFMEDGGYSDRKWWSDAGWAWLQEEGVTEPALLARPALEWPQPAGGRRQLLRGRGLLRLGGRAPAAGTGMGGRRPRPGGLRVPLGRRLEGRDLQHLRGRPRTRPRRSGSSPVPARPNWVSRIWPATSGSGVRRHVIRS